MIKATLKIALRFSSMVRLWATLTDQELLTQKLNEYTGPTLVGHTKMLDTENFMSEESSGTRGNLCCQDCPQSSTTVLSGANKMLLYEWQHNIRWGEQNIGEIGWLNNAIFPGGGLHCWVIHGRIIEPSGTTGT